MQRPSTPEGGDTQQSSSSSSTGGSSSSSSSTGGSVPSGAPFFLFLTSKKVDGILAGGQAGALSCKGWTSASPADDGAVSRAGIEDSSTSWTEDGGNDASCSGSYRLACIEVP